MRLNIGEAITTTETRVGTLKIGDAVWMREYSSWGPSRYTRGTVKAITGSGLVDISWGDAGSAVKRFNQDGRERGQGYHGWSLDLKIPFKERELQISKQNRIDEAVVILRKFEASKANNCVDLEWLEGELARLRDLLDKFDAAVAAVEPNKKAEGGK